MEIYILDSVDVGGGGRTLARGMILYVYSISIAYLPTGRK